MTNGLKTVIKIEGKCEPNPDKNRRKTINAREHVALFTNVQAKQNTLEDRNKTRCCAMNWPAESKFILVYHCENDIM